MNNYINHTECPICGTKTLDTFLSTTDYFSSQECFNLSRCSNCSLVLTNPRPSAAVLDTYYDSQNYISHSEEASGFINSLYRLVQNFNMWLKYRSIQNEVPRGTWLDYGCGNGAFMKYLSNRGVTIAGYEPNDLAFATTQKNKLITYNKVSDLPKEEKYSAVMMWHVLEHVHNPLEILKDHFNRLSHNGKLILALPNYQSYDAEIYKQYWAAYDVPRHLWHYSSKALSRLAEAAGFEIIKTKPLYLDSYYIALLSEKYKNGFAPRGILNGLVSNIKARMGQAPFSSQIYILKKKAF